MTADLSSTLTSAAPYLGIATGIIVPALFWARNVTEKLSSIKDNHLAHIEKAHRGDDQAPGGDQDHPPGAPMTIWAAIKSVARFAWSRVEQGVKWATSVASEPDGTGSASRVCFFLITATVCGVLAGHLYLKHSLPDQGTLLGLGGLLTAGAAGYGTNKVASRLGPGSKE